MKGTSARPPALWQALLPVAFLILFLVVQISFFDGPPHLPLILASVVAAVMGLSLGHPWNEIEVGIIEGIAVALKAILILMVVGILIGTWIAGGIVPVLIDYGLRLLSPSYFLLAACLICSVVSIATGSSWTTAGTVGVALDRHRGGPRRFSADDRGCDRFRRLLRRQDVSTLRLDQPIARGRGRRAVRSHPVHGVHGASRVHPGARYVRDSSASPRRPAPSRARRSRRSARCWARTST